MNKTPGIGHNLAPAFNPETVAGFKPKVQDFADAAGAWLDKGEIETAEQAEKLNDYITGCRKLAKQIEDARQIDKKPIIVAGKLIEATYQALSGPLKKAMDRVNPLLTKWSIKVAEVAAKAKREAEKAARAKYEAAQKLAKETEARHDVVGEAEAEQALKDADKAAKAAARTTTSGQVKSASGGGRTAALRTTYKARIDKPKMAMLWALTNHPAEVDAFVIKLAEAAKRFNKTQEIPGVKFIEDRRIA